MRSVGSSDPVDVHAPVEDVSRRDLGNNVALTFVMVVIGFLVRLWFAIRNFLNPDEALHYLLTVQPSISATYKASLSTAHPPLYLLLLHYWGQLGHAEWFLRLPSVLAGIAFCWVMFLWVRRVLDEQIAFFTLFLFLFSPSIIWLSAEVRQYPALLLFAACSLYLFERAVQEKSIGWMVLSSTCLLLAILTHYSALIFALALGVYGLARLILVRTPGPVAAAWSVGQLAALVLTGFLLITHVSHLRSEGLPRLIFDSYLKRSIYHSQTESAVYFVGRSTFRVFHYFMAQGAVGAVALLLFIAGVAILFRSGHEKSFQRPSPTLLAAFLILPFVANCVVALAGVYPYGGTRHDSYLAIFMMPAIAVPLARWKPSWRWTKVAAIAVVLCICNLFPAALGEYIPPRQQNRKWMIDAIDYLKQTAPRGSTLLVGDQGKLLLTYYMCPNNRIPYEEPMPEFLESVCAGYRMIALNSYYWDFRQDTFSTELHDAQQIFHLEPGTKLWMVELGWYVDKKLRAQLPEYGCQEPHQFGGDIFICPISPN